MKHLFDTIRDIVSRPLTQSEVDRINMALEGRRAPDIPSLPERQGTPRTIGKAGIDLIKSFEGCHKVIAGGKVKAYPDPGTGGRPWTIGWGSTRGFDGGPIQPGTIMTQSEVDQLLGRDLEEFAKGVAQGLGNSLRATSQPQFDAMVSFAYNVGVQAFKRSTLLKKHIAGDHREAARQFLRWNKAGGRVLRGLTRRREAEAALYRSGS